MNGAITFAEIEQLTNFNLGIVDTACPLCGPGRTSPANRRRRVLRIWRSEPGFATYKCARCGLDGWAREASARRASIIGTKPAKLLARDSSEEHARRQHTRALALWRHRLLATNSPVESYLCRIRRYGGAIPATVGFLPTSKPGHHPAMIAAFGFCEEPEPGVLAIADEAVRGVHLTLLKPDGSGKAEVEPNKLMVGPSNGRPIVLVPPNDMLGLVICEGLETGLSLAEATGCGVWAAGAAGRMPALAGEVPPWLDSVTIAAEADAAGRKGALGLADRLKARGVHVEISILTGPERKAA